MDYAAVAMSIQWVEQRACENAELRKLQEVLRLNVKCDGVTPLRPLSHRGRWRIRRIAELVEVYE